MRKLECPLSHNKQHHQQKQQADEEEEGDGDWDGDGDGEKRKRSFVEPAKWSLRCKQQHVAEQQFMMLPLTGECCLQLLLMTMMISRMQRRFDNVTL